jgi:hypothetical protein
MRCFVVSATLLAAVPTSLIDLISELRINLENNRGRGLSSKQLIEENETRNLSGSVILNPISETGFQN